MIKTPEVYGYIKANDIEKVREYLVQVNENTTDNVNTTQGKLDALLAYATDWKRNEIVKLFVDYSANPNLFDRIIMYYGITNTNALPNNELTDYLRDGVKDVQQC